MSEEPLEIVTSSTGGKKGRKAADYAQIPPVPLEALARVYTFGADRYGAANYLQGYDWSLNYSALFRHIEATRMGEWIDPESGYPHLAHAAWHLFTLMEYMDDYEEYRQFDDRDRGRDSRPSAQRASMAPVINSPDEDTYGSGFILTEGSQGCPGYPCTCGFHRSTGVPDPGIPNEEPGVR